MKKKLLMSAMLLTSVLTLAACGSKSSDDTSASSDAKVEESTSTAALKDGTYTAESGFDERGWKVVHTITVKDGKIESSNFDYENADGAKKSEDEEYNKNMEAKSGISSKDATAKLNEELVETQNVDDVETVSGATHSSENFKVSAEALLKAAAEGNTDTVEIDLGE
ncbi:Major membrane immunogen, membrane-anchored lipoprotein [Streptococcus henryi]|jgi:major membrane immunogen (membrane-anchored lipoprotein)|uniref:Major membrane immunogen, membrane-anchored lipoprotein n=1 Tax=Streptococcus henryi TaxID=439219 RepID=A0A1G6A9M7_9STRE|nr:FMN-binding protein [Streptococcus henryi]SDB05121.1 Major membrane immunogen, membrane-anchored lipoprotein [Streptococcus henryi]